jgi:hypothetical protein
MDGDMRNRRAAIGAPPFERVASGLHVVSVVAAIEAMRARKGNGAPSLGNSTARLLATERQTVFQRSALSVSSDQATRLMLFTCGRWPALLLMVILGLAVLGGE